MLEVNIKNIKCYLDDIGIKQKVVAERAGLGEAKLCLILQGKRELKASEYANICKAIGVPMDTFLKEKE